MSSGGYVKFTVGLPTGKQSGTARSELPESRAFDPLDTDDDWWPMTEDDVQEHPIDEAAYQAMKLRMIARIISNNEEAIRAMVQILGPIPRVVPSEPVTENPEPDVGPIIGDRVEHVLYGQTPDDKGIFHYTITHNLKQEYPEIDLPADTEKNVLISTVDENTVRLFSFNSLHGTGVTIKKV